MGRVARGLLAGALGGAAGAVAMNLAQAGTRRAAEFSGLPQPGGERSEQNEPKDREDNPTTRFYRSLTGDDHEGGGTLVHVLFGAAAGAVYGGAAAVDLRVTTGAGVPFGAAVWLFANEAGLTLAGLSKTPDQYSPATHAFALFSHLVYGVVTDRAVRLSLGS